MTQERVVCLSANITSVTSLWASTGTNLPQAVDVVVSRTNLVLLLQVGREGEVLHIIDVVECRYRADVLGDTGTPRALLLVLLLPGPPWLGALLQGDREHLPATDLGEVVHPGELQEGGHAVQKGADDEPVQRSGVVDLGEAGPAVQGDGGEREDGRDTLK